MKDLVLFEPLTPKKYTDYIRVGTLAYDQHYKHLWPNGNTTPYLESSFTNEVLAKEAKDDNTILYLIYFARKVVGIFKITINAPILSYASEESLCIDKIYILNEYSGKGIGGKILQFVILRAQEMNKKIVWLDTMQKGPALQFYLKNGFQISGESKVLFESVIEDLSLMYIMTKEV